MKRNDISSSRINKGKPVYKYNKKGNQKLCCKSIKLYNYN